MPCVQGSVKSRCFRQFRNVILHRSKHQLLQFHFRQQFRIRHGDHCPKCLHRLLEHATRSQGMTLTRKNGLQQRPIFADWRQPTCADRQRKDGTVSIIIMVESHKHKIISTNIIGILSTHTTSSSKSSNYG